MGLINRLKELKDLEVESLFSDLSQDGSELDDPSLVEVDDEEALLEDETLDYGALDPELEEEDEAPKAAKSRAKKPVKKRKRPKYGPRGTVGPAPRFTWREVACSDGTSIPGNLRGNAVRVARSMNNLRIRVAKHYGVPVANVYVQVNSWYRTPAYNRKIGGVSNSQHLTGKAMDVVFTVKTKRGLKRVPTKVLFRIGGNCYRFAHGGRGLYPNFNHFDVGPGPRTWVGSGGG
jgi:hypothetical protein